MKPPCTIAHNKDMNRTAIGGELATNGSNKHGGSPAVAGQAMPIRPLRNITY